MKGPTCPLCGSPRSQEWRPFCSRRCSDIDLQRWMSGRYVVPAPPDDEEDSAPIPEEET